MPEPFINYISEGSVSISTCKFEALPVETPLAKTAYLVTGGDRNVGRFLRKTSLPLASYLRPSPQIRLL